MIKDTLPADRREPFERWIITAPEEPYSFAPTTHFAALELQPTCYHAVGSFARRQGCAVWP